MSRSSGSAIQTSPSAPYTDERAALASVLASPVFTRSPNLAKILTYLCESHFQGLGDAIKEYSIGMEALGRGASFDPRLSSVVRVEVSRLRKRLTQYYASEGAVDPIQIVLPEAGYKPQFIERVAPVSASKTGACAVPEPLADTEEAVDGLTRWKRLPFSRPTAIRKSGIAVLLFIGALGAFLVLSRNTPTPVTVRSVAGPASPGIQAFEPSAILIRPGAQTPVYADRLGRNWGMDRFFSGGSPFNRPVRVYGTVDPSLYQSGREGSFAYTIPAPNARYELHLHFAETFWGYERSDSDGSGMRFFDVRLNGRTILSGFDIVSDAGGPNIADERVFAGVSPASDGLIHLEFIGRIGAALLNGIELFPSTGAAMRPVRIAAGGDSYVDRKGNSWGPDRYFFGGRAQRHVLLTAGTDDPGLYSAEHWGHFSYRVPVAPGIYTVRLRFAERHYGRSNIEGDVGSRRFNVYCNGVTLLKNFDIIKEASGENRALDMIFRGVPSNAQGKIVLSFEPGNTYATVNGIEVLAEE